MDILNVMEKLYVDNSLSSLQEHTYEPYLPTKLGYNDEITIAVHELDTPTLPCESYLYIEGTLTDETGKYNADLKFVNNGIAFLFKEVRYQLNGVTVDSTRDVGITSTLKGYCSHNFNESIKLQNAGWFPTASGTKTIVDNKGNFSCCLPLKMLLGFFEDYRKIMVHVKQELVLLRTSDDVNAVTCITATIKPKITLTKVAWRVPHVTVDIARQLALTKLIDTGADILLGFRSWELIEYPELNKTTRHVWPVKTSTRVETPRHVIVAFQENKRNLITADMSKFDNCNLRNVKAFLNSDRYPYDDLHIDFNTNKYSTLYEMYSKFRQSYYGLPNEPLFSPREYLNIAPLVYIDCSRQQEALQTGPVVMRLEFETITAIDATKSTSAYCLVLHDKLFSYNPLNKIVKQV